MFGIATHLIAIIHRLRQAVAAYAAAQARGPAVVWLGTQAFIAAPPPSRHAPIAAETWHLLNARLGRLSARLLALFTRWQAGTLPAPRMGPHPARIAPPRTRAPYLRLPAARGWINARIPEAAPCAGAIHAIVQHPGLRPFLAAAPQAARLLRPLCHALAADLPPWLRLPPRHRKPRFRKPNPLAPLPPSSLAPFALKTSVPPAATPDRPIPSYVLAAARAWNPKKARRV